MKRPPKPAFATRPASEVYSDADVLALNGVAIAITKELMNACSSATRPDRCDPMQMAFVLASVMTNVAKNGDETNGSGEAFLHNTLTLLARFRAATLDGTFKEVPVESLRQ